MYLESSEPWVKPVHLIFEGNNTIEDLHSQDKEWKMGVGPWSWMFYTISLSLLESLRLFEGFMWRTPLPVSAKRPRQERWEVQWGRACRSQVSWGLLAVFHWGVFASVVRRDVGLWRLRYVIRVIVAAQNGLGNVPSSSIFGSKYEGWC